MEARSSPPTGTRREPAPALRRRALASSFASRLRGRRSAEGRPLAEASENVHATAIALGGNAALIRGAPGSGKSDLALRCLAIAPTALVPCPASLVADD